MVRLSPFQQSDFDLFISWIKDEDLLMTIAGHELGFPVTRDQLQGYIEKSDSYAFNVVDDASDKKIGHAQLARTGDRKFKIDKVIIGDESTRGKGLGQLVMRQLLDQAFDNLDAEAVELMVFDWNISGIRCYQKCGFEIEEGPGMPFKIGERTWIALKMTITRRQWLDSN
jgi:RimJ/RimL family protein N-acetyltransferase